MRNVVPSGPDIDAKSGKTPSPVDLEVIVEPPPDIASVAAVDRSIDYWNGRGMDFTGHTPTADDRRDWRGLVDPGDARLAERGSGHAARGGASCDAAYRVRRRDVQDSGHAFWVLPIADESATPLRWLSTASDIDDGEQPSVDQYHGCHPSAKTRGSAKMWPR